MKTAQKPRNISLILFISFVVLVVAAAFGYVLFREPILEYLTGGSEDSSDLEEETVAIPDTTGIMLLIEFEGTEGLENFVYEMNERDIPGLLMVSAGFVEDNCELIRTMQDYSIEVTGVYPEKPLWDVSYDEQYDIMSDTKTRVEACTGVPMRAFSSRYFAYDENTVKAAEALEIPYVMARGTTGAKATIYQPEEYDVKIFSVSNVDSESWGTGSLCDYSYWAREGEPGDFRQEMFGAYQKYDKISPVSHTYIGGLKARWNEVYLNFFDQTDINWVGLDEFGQVDVYATFAEIPDNREVQYDTPKPATPLDEEPDVDNPCSVGEIDESSSSGSDNGETMAAEVVMFHNGIGPMCLDAVDFFGEEGIAYTEYLTGDPDFSTELSAYKSEYGEESEGISTSYGYYPYIFVGEKAFSGFNDDIAQSILDELGT
jgi:hypothetical protein